jgi:hypothetical protein
LAIHSSLEAGAAKKALRARDFLAPVGRQASHGFHCGGPVGKFGRSERPPITAEQETGRNDNACGGKSTFEECFPGDEKARCARDRLGHGVGLFAGENSLECRFEPSMRILERADAPGNV